MNFKLFSRQKNIYKLISETRNPGEKRTESRKSNETKVLEKECAETCWSNYPDLRGNYPDIVGGLLPVVLVMLVLVLMFCFAATPAVAAENAKINLPDGLYLYDAIVSKSEVKAHVGFQKYFVVQKNIIYSSKEAIKKFGISKLNKSFTENKKYKILLGGEKVGEILNLIVDDEGDHVYKDEFLNKNIKKGPMYGGSRLGSAVNYIAVPEGYKEVQRNVYKTISKEEIEKISKLANDKLLPLVKNRKEVKKYKVKEAELFREELRLLDKISYRNDDMYIGIYYCTFATVKNTDRFDVGILFSITKDNVSIITSDYDDETLDFGNTSIYGMLDVDGCGEEELIIEKEYPSEDKAITNLEIYKQKADGSWKRIQKISWRVEL
jgi:hypothetical protein